MKTALAALALAVLPALAGAACPDHETVTMSCPEGKTFDTTTNSCITPTG